MLKRFNIDEIRPITTLTSHFRLSFSQCPNSQEEEDGMSRVPYASAVRSLMYTMVYTRPDVAYAVSTNKSVHVESKQAKLRSSEVGATISARDCEIRLGVSEVGNREA